MERGAPRRPTTVKRTKHTEKGVVYGTYTERQAAKEEKKTEKYKTIIMLYMWKNFV